MTQCQNRQYRGARNELLNLGFLKFDVLSSNGIIFPHAHLFSLIARILLGDIEETGAGCRKQFDFLSNWLCHEVILRFVCDTCEHLHNAQITEETLSVKGREGRRSDQFIATVV